MGRKLRRRNRLVENRAEKMGVKEGTRSIFVNAPEAARAEIDPPSLDVASELAGKFGYIP